MTIRHLLHTMAAAALSLAVASCGEDNLSAPLPQTDTSADFWAQYDFVLAEEIESRVSYDNMKSAHFEEGDEVGIYVLDANLNAMQGEGNTENVRYKVVTITNVQTDETTRQVLVPANTGESVERQDGCRYVLYYPYNANMTSAALRNYTHTVEADQSVGESVVNSSLTALERSDLLWAFFTPTEGNPNVITFCHAMAQVVVRVNESDVYMADNTEYAGVYLLNMPTQATGIDLAQAPADMRYAIYRVPNQLIRCCPVDFGSAAAGVKEFRAMVPAHDITLVEETGNTLPVVRVYHSSSEQDYTDYSLSAEASLRPGHTYTIDLSLSQTH